MKSVAARENEMRSKAIVPTQGPAPEGPVNPRSHWHAATLVDASGLVDPAWKSHPAKRAELQPRKKGVDERMLTPQAEQVTVAVAPV